MFKERWRKIRGELPYEVSDRGRIVTFPGLEPVPCFVQYGHLRVTLGREDTLARGFYPTGGLVHMCVARLVYTTFIGPIPNGAQVCTRNKQPKDCSMENLVLVEPRR